MIDDWIKKVENIVQSNIVRILRLGAEKEAGEQSNSQNFNRTMTSSL